jgi:hypothetical protein
MVNDMNKKRVLIFGVMIMLIFSTILSGCHVDIVSKALTLEELYSRENVKKVTESANFGDGTTDQMYVILDYIYTNDELRKKYGDTFVVCNFGGAGDMKTFMFYQLYKGTYNGFVDINNDRWDVNLSKSYFGKWKVTSCSPKNN